ncbi:MAG: M3 family metallopeptidase [Gammaproteobacteria bacterium]|nr:M3 family metallopeptidase [Gammaproteobacteria bacterium]
MNAHAAHTLARVPRYAELDAAGAVARIDALLAAQRARIAALTSQTEPDWDSIVAPMEEMADELHRLFGPLSHLHNVADNEALRAAYTECVARVSAFGAELEQNAALCAAYQKLRASPAFAGYDRAQRRLIDNALRDFRLGGVDLPDATKARVTTLRVELAQLANRFEEQVLDATQGYALDVDDEARLAGLPASTLAMARARAEQQGLGGWRLTLDLPCYVPAMSNLADRDLRRALYEAYTTRASEQGPQAGKHDNGPVMHELLARRQELARLLGFGNYAELSLATKMAPSTDAVIAFLEDLARQARPAAAREFAELEAFARAELGLEALAAWDVAYAAEQLRRHRYQLNQEELRPYFPLPRVRAGLFDIAGRVFGLAFEPVSGVDTWHPDVEFHAVKDADGEPLGFFYLDLYARAGKRSGAWMDDCLPRWQQGPATQLPVAYLNCNFTPPQNGRPSLLTHDEMTTLFHEFGHGLHHLLTTIGRPAVAGINGVPWDAVELPSQFLENWCWSRESLDLLSAHVDTGEPLPRALFDRLNAARHFQAGMQTVRQLEFALFDFKLHRDYAPGLDIQALLDDVRRAVAVVTPPAWNRFQHSFTHIFAGGYAAGYYSYKWAEVLSADAFERFTEEGIFNAATGRAFRETVLANGGAEDALELFRRFRGRDPEVAPLLRQAGLLG